MNAFKQVFFINLKNMDQFCQGTELTPDTGGFSQRFFFQSWRVDLHSLDLHKPNF